MSVTAFIPARCGSKSIKFKNIKLFCGKPLIYWNLKALQDTENVDKIVVATDCKEIEDYALSLNFPKLSVYKRLKENASDTSPTEAVMVEYISNKILSKDNIFMLVQATSPLTQTKDYTEAINLYQNNNFDSVLSCVRIKRFFWNENGTPSNYDYNNRPRRQDFKGQLVENGALYINSVENILLNNNRLSGSIGIHEMPEYSFVELVEEDDWNIAEKLMRKYILGSEKRDFNIKLFLSDVDGVLTDSGMYYTENGDEIKKFSTYDGKGFEILRLNNILTGIVTAEDRLLNKRRAEKLKLDFDFHGIKDKLSVVTELCANLGISLNEVAYIGDDINDFELLSKVGMAACPANSVKKIKDIEGIILLEKNGGSGVVREFIELFFDKNN
jgi:N-acylneuraminate cytidylyltransferase